jgi:hypothetical protein
VCAKKDALCVWELAGSRCCAAHGGAGEGCAPLVVSLLYMMPGHSTVRSCIANGSPRTVQKQNPNTDPPAAIATMPAAVRPTITSAVQKRNDIRMVGMASNATASFSSSPVHARTVVYIVVVVVVCVHVCMYV